MDTPETYAQFGSEAGDIMWRQHQLMRRLELENERMLSDIERLEKKHDDMLADIGDILKHLAASIRFDLRESKPATMARIEKSIRGESD